MTTMTKLTMKEIEEIVEIAKKYPMRDVDGFMTELRLAFGGEVEKDVDVDDRDAPNTYPYKKCSLCGERSSCGLYKEDDWVCEGCDEGECDECGTGLTADTHIFIYSKDGEEDVTVCQDCGEDMDGELREKGYTRDDDEKVTTPVPVPEPVPEPVKKEKKKKVRTYCFSCRDDSGEPVQKCRECGDDVCVDCRGNEDDKAEMVCIKCEEQLEPNYDGYVGTAEEPTCLICDAELDAEEYEDYFDKNGAMKRDILCETCAWDWDWCDTRFAYIPSKSEIERLMEKKREKERQMRRAMKV